MRICRCGAWNTACTLIRSSGLKQNAHRSEDEKGISIDTRASIGMTVITYLAVRLIVSRTVSAVWAFANVDAMHTVCSHV